MTAKLIKLFQILIILQVVKCLFKTNRRIDPLLSLMFPC